MYGGSLYLLYFLTGKGEKRNAFLHCDVEPEEILPLI